MSRTIMQVVEKVAARISASERTETQLGSRIKLKGGE